MIKVLRFKQFVTETFGEYRKGSEKYSGLIHDLQLVINNYLLDNFDLSKPIIKDKTEFFKNVKFTEKELIDFIKSKEFRNLISYDIAIDNKNIIFSNLNNTNKQRLIWENFD